MKRRHCLRLFGAGALLLAGCGRREGEAVLAPGKVLPAVELPDLAGEPVRLPGGRPALLNFWATWCPPCRAEMASLDRLYRRLHGGGLAMFGISVDEDVNLVREFVLGRGLGFPILMDRGARVAQGMLAVRNFPTSVLVSRDGRVAEVVVGGREWDRAPLADAVLALLR